MSLHSALLTHVGLPLVSLAARSEFWPLYRGMCRRRMGDRGDVTAGAAPGRLRALLEHAQRTVPFYRERFDACGFDPAALRTTSDLERLPPLTKQDVARSFPDRITSTQRSFPPWRYAATSGTVERLTVVQDFRKRDHSRAADLLGLRMAVGYQPGMRYLRIPPDVCRNVCGVGATAQPSLFGYLAEAARQRMLFDPDVVSNIRGIVWRQLVYRTLELPGLARDGLVQPPDVLDHYLDEIDACRPHVIKALPIYFHLLALRLEDTGRLPPRQAGNLMPMGSSMIPHVRRVAEAAFGARVHEDYGSAEAGAIAVECGHQSGLHPHDELFHVEIVRKGRQAAPGEPGRVLLTDLVNYAMPLIRYDIGDVAIPRTGTCACGVEAPRFEVVGRIQDSLMDDDGDVVCADRIGDAVMASPGVLGFQLDERATSLDVKVVARPGRDVSLDDVIERLEALLGKRRRISTRRVGNIPPERSGKYRFVRSATGGASDAL